MDSSTRCALANGTKTDLTQDIQFVKSVHPEFEVYRLESLSAKRNEDATVA